MILYLVCTFFIDGVTVMCKKIAVRLLICMAFLSLLSCISSSFASVTTDSFNLHQVEEGIYLHYGGHFTFEDMNEDDIANIGFIVGEQCIAVIDTGGSVKIGKKLLVAIRSVSALPVCYVINTHVHFDHILGNLAFQNDSVQFVGHAKLPDAVENNRNFFLQRFAKHLGDMPSKEAIISPQLTVDNTMQLDLGNRSILLTAYPIAHSHSDLTIFDSRTKTLWAGDLIFRERIPVLDGNLKGWLEVLQGMQVQDVATLIPGHGTISNSWPQAYAPQYGYLEMLLSETRQAIVDGKFLEDAVHSIGSETHEKWLLHEQYHRGNITKAFVELEWE